MLMRFTLFNFFIADNLSSAVKATLNFGDEVLNKLRQFIDLDLSLLGAIILCPQSVVVGLEWE